ncbi:MAG TPA: alpha/beta fold hydrolase [Rhizomicrobium sp.]|jgi:dipeptidyl aminopeptidase/acylaminoacyl peptidase|nr:alpha/beta fold hydrolase [Rhizomicrobium sp.]
MRLFELAAGVCAVACLAWSAAAAPTLETYGELPSLDNFAVSPNGHNLAYATFVDGKHTVLINSIDQGKVIGGIAVDAQKLRDIQWGDDDHVLITVSTTRFDSENYFVESYSLSEKHADILLDHGAGHENVILGVPMVRVVDGKSVAFVRGITIIDQTGVDALFVEDLQSGRLNHIIEPGSREHATNWFIDEAGNVIARTQYADDTGRWRLQIKHGAGYSDAYVMDAPLDQPSVLGITNDGKSIVITTNVNGTTGVRQYSLADNHAETPIVTLTGDIAPIEDPATHRMIGIVQVGLHDTVTFFDPADQSAWNGLTRAFPDETVTLASWSRDRKVVVVRVDGARDGTGYFMVDLTTHKASFLGSTYNGIEPADMQSKTAIFYTAKDGTKIPAFLTLPKGKAPKGLPLVVLPHGGPEAHDDAQFDWLSQALAARGYAVLQPQFRGSDGFGEDFLEAGYGQWGRKMQTDLSDGMRYLAAQGTIDPKRVCIVGASYGGYAALAGAALDTGAYRCAVSDSGVSDPHAMMQWIRGNGSANTTAIRYWTRFLGTEDMNDPKLDEISPLRHVDKVTIPVLLIHGSADTVVPIDQSEEFATAMRGAGKPVTFVKLDREDHWLSTSQTRAQMLKATVDFLEANNPSN